MMIIRKKHKKNIENQFRKVMEFNDLIVQKI